MVKATVHYAKTHLSRLLKEVERGETIVILRGEIPVAQLVRIESTLPARPKVGDVTSTGVSWEDDALQPVTDKQLEDWLL